MFDEVNIRVSKMSAFEGKAEAVLGTLTPDSDP
jgi:hypothetical protein